MMTNLTSRVEFRSVVKQVISCLKENFKDPGLAPLTAEELHYWLQEITVEDIRAVESEIEASVAERSEKASSLLP